MNGLYTIILLLLSNVFMTLAWYGHLRLQQSGISGNWPLIGVIAFSWGIAFLEYCCQPVESDSGVHFLGGLCDYCQHHVSRAESPLEPHPCVSLNHLCRISCFHEIRWCRLNDRNERS